MLYILQIGRSMETEMRVIVIRSQGEEKKEVTANGVQDSFRVVKMF